MIGLESIRIWIEFDKNEKPLKVNLNHQTATIDTMYKFVDGSMLHVDDKLKGIVDNFNTLGKNGSRGFELHNQYEDEEYSSTRI